MKPDNGLDDRGIWVRFLIDTRDFSLPHKAQTEFGAQPASYSVGIGGCFARGKRLCVRMIIHFHLVPRIRLMELSIIPPYVLITFCLIN
jgi:hypothetical protein